MNIQKGDAIYALVPIVNDGSVPNAEADEVFAQPGDMGMLINTGHLEEDPSQELYLVSFSLPSGEMGPPVTCLPEEVSAEPVKLQ
ncbi:MAG: nitrogen fixation protein NifZ [Oceanobacter sp.]